MNNLDFTPFYRSFIGFDHLANLMNAAARNEKQPAYCITMAIAGFSEQELSIETEHNTLVVQGQRDNKDNGRHFVHQGIAERNFERKFQLSEYVKVTGASLENGLLHITLVREVPEALKPRKITIGKSKQPHLVTEERNSQLETSKVKAAVNS